MIAPREQTHHASTPHFEIMDWNAEGSIDTHASLENSTPATCSENSLDGFHTIDMLVDSWVISLMSISVQLTIFNHWILDWGKWFAELMHLTTPTPARTSVISVVLSQHSLRRQQQNSHNFWFISFQMPQMVCLASPKMNPWGLLHICVHQLMGHALGGWSDDLPTGCGNGASAGHPFFLGRVAGHKVVGKVDLECARALLMCREATRGANCKSCNRMRIGRPRTVDAQGTVLSRTQSGGVGVWNGSLEQGSR